MRHHRPLHHPLESLFARSAQSLTTALSDGTRRVYQGAFRSFLLYLAAHHPEVSRLQQLQRDPHILGWLADLRSHTPPFAKITIIIRVTYLHRMLQDLSWNHQIHLLLISSVGLMSRVAMNAPRVRYCRNKISSSNRNCSTAMISLVISCCSSGTPACALASVWISP
jgi:hypothetical protein